MTPLERYQHDLDRQLISDDPAQRAALQYLQTLFDQLSKSQDSTGSWWQATVRKLLPASTSSAARSLYFWGGVGRGKTYLMDIFYESLPDERKMRTHFHRFMQRVHNDLTVLKGSKDPLVLVARRLAEQARVICFDEFFVSDIGDAMLLAGLLEELFRQGVILVMTSNSVPDALYENGLQRSRFLPAIALLKQHADVVELNGGIDYRLRQLSQASLYHWPLGAAAEQQLAEHFAVLVPDYQAVKIAEPIEILGRTIPCRRASDDVIWFDFSQLCGGPRSAFDYIEIARLYHAILLSDLPQLDHRQEDLARRFVNLVDELYDHNVKLIIAAAVPLEKLYQGTLLVQVFQRTLSRLQEMQSRDYLGRPHKP